jgi:hypothetical protein
MLEYRYPNFPDNQIEELTAPGHWLLAISKEK